MPRLWRHRDEHTSLLDLAGRSRPAFFCLRLCKGLKPLRKICEIGAPGLWRNCVKSHASLWRHFATLRESL